MIYYWKVRVWDELGEATDWTKLPVGNGIDQ